jgi:hypothetical protein
MAVLLVALPPLVAVVVLMLPVLLPVLPVPTPPDVVRAGGAPPGSGSLVVKSPTSLSLHSQLPRHTWVKHLHEGRALQEQEEWVGETPAASVVGVMAVEEVHKGPQVGSHKRKPLC